jgi:hypothetical protein
MSPEGLQPRQTGSGKHEALDSEKLRALLDRMPEKPPRSKLEPHMDVIRQLRRKGRTYQEIARFFAEHLGIPVAASTIHAFIKVRARQRQRRPPIELPPATVQEIETAPTTLDAVPPAEPNVRDRIEAVKQRRLPEKAHKQRFEYNEEEPLQLIPGTKQEG